MSRVGRRPIEIPNAVKIDVNGLKITVEAKGKKIEHQLPEGFSAEVADNNITIMRPSDSREHRSIHGTTRSLLQNIIIGLVDGFEKKLEIQGVGYRAQLKGKALALEIGKSHTVIYNPPEGVAIETPSQTEILVKGADKQQVGQAASDIRELYPPEPYKGKGIRYQGEYVRRKQGKSIA